MSTTQSRSSRSAFFSVPTCMRRAPAICTDDCPARDRRELGFGGSTSRSRRCISTMPCSRSSLAENGRLPTSASYSITPSE
ncbi:MAG TPA: hypothetical protein VFZ65_00385 [Planctomycetota bacterium]|nr:hypothetical protein [Planctomycetota bacterium]